MAKNPIIMELPLNGSLAGRDRDGVFTATGSGALRYQPAEGARVNRVLNPRFANDTANWTGSTATISRVADAEFAGGYALNVNVTAAGIGRGARTSGFEQGWRFGQGQRTFSFDAKTISAATQFDVYAVEYDAAGTLLASGVVGTAKTLTSSVQRFSQSYTPTNASTEVVHFGLRTKNSETAELRISNAVVEEGNIASPTYFDGSFAGASWFNPRTGQLGTAHASPSCEQLTAWVEEGTTNLLSNPGAEAATLGAQISPWNSAVITKDTTRAYMGAASVKVMTPGSVIREGVGFVGPPTGLGFTGVRTHKGSIYLSGSGVIDVYTRWQFSDATTLDSTPVTVTLTNAWQRVQAATLSTDGTKTADYVFIFARTSNTVAAQAVTFYADCAQVEEKSYCTSYCDGSLGTGYSWAGTAHASASTRTVTSVYRTKADVIASGFSSISGSWIARVLVPSDEGKFTTILSESDGYGSSDWLGLSYTNGEVLKQRSKVQANAEVSVSSLGTVVYGSAYIAYGGWSDSVFVAVDSEPAVSALRVDTATNDVGVITFGGAGVEILNGYLGPVAIYDRPLTDAERAKLDAAIDTWTPLWRLLGSNRYNQFQLRPIGA